MENNLRENKRIVKFKGTRDAKYQDKFKIKESTAIQIQLKQMSLFKKVGFKPPCKNGPTVNVSDVKWD